MKQFCPCCGADKVFKNIKLAQLVFSCRACEANFFVVVTTYPKNKS